MTSANASVPARQCIHVAFAINDGFAIGAGVCMVSILENNKHLDFIFHIFSLARLSDANLEKFAMLERRYNTTVRHHILENHGFERFAGLPLLQAGSGYHYTLDTFSRFLMPDIISEQFPGVGAFFYLDADVVCDARIDPYLAMDLGGAVAAAGYDNTPAHERRLGMAPGSYFNAGVMYVNIPAWKKHDVARRASETLLRDPRVRLLDQDALNIILEGRVIMVPRDYNYAFAFDNPKAGMITGKIFIHYIGSMKPWFDCFAETAPFNRNLALSPWRDYKHGWGRPGAKLSRVYGRYLLRHGRMARGLRFYWRYIKMRALGKAGFFSRTGA